jgi:hypothetical protein
MSSESKLESNEIYPAISINNSTSSINSISSSSASSTPFNLPFNIYISSFDSKTFDEWQKAPIKAFHTEKQPRKPKHGDIIVCISLDDDAIVVLMELKGKPSRHELLDYDTYSKDASKYNNYEFPLARYWMLPTPLKFTDIATFCGITEHDKTPNNLIKGTTIAYACPFYKGANHIIIVKRYETLIKSLMVDITPNYSDV